MKARGVAMYMAGQIGLMSILRYYQQWTVSFVSGDGRAPALLGAGAFALALAAFRVFDAVIDPPIGAFSDGWVQRGRKRRALLVFALPLAPLGLVLLFSPSHDMALGVRWLWAGVGMLCLFAGYSLYSIPLWSLVGDDSAGDLALRTRLSNSLGLGLFIATGLGFVLVPPLIERVGFRLGALVVALAGALSMTLPYFAGTRGAAGAPAAPSARPSVGTWAALRRAAQSRRFRAVVALFVGVQMSLTVMSAAAPYIAEHLLGGGLGDVPLLLGPFLGSTLFFFAFVRGWTARYGWERVCLVGAASLFVTYALTGLLGRAVIGSPMTTAMLVFGSAGPGMAVMLGLEAQAVVGLAAESDVEATGSYFGLFNLCVQALNGVALGLTHLLAARASESAWAVRGMCWLAGGFCLFGVLGYLQANAHVFRGRGEEPGPSG